MLGFRAGITNVVGSAIAALGITSEANQFKVHKTGTLVATSNNQIFTIEHNLGYAPAYLVFLRQTTFNAYYSLLVQGGSNYINKTTLSIQIFNSGDLVTYIIFKDFGA